MSWWWKDKKEEAVKSDIELYSPAERLERFRNKSNDAMLKQETERLEKVRPIVVLPDTPKPHLPSSIRCDASGILPWHSSCSGVSTIACSGDLGSYLLCYPSGCLPQHILDAVPPHTLKKYGHG